MGIPVILDYLLSLKTSVLALSLLQVHLEVISVLLPLIEG